MPDSHVVDCLSDHLEGDSSLAQRAPDSVIDSRRFRPNLLLELAAQGGARSEWPEIDLVGHTLAIGATEFEIVMPMMRCVMTTHAQQGLPKDPSIMRTLVPQFSAITWTGRPAISALDMW